MLIHYDVPAFASLRRGRRWIYSGDYRAGATLCSIPNQTGKPRIADGTLA